MKQTLIGLIEVAVVASVTWWALPISFAHAQEVIHPAALDPNVSIQAYLTDDPIDPNSIGLATPYGRFAMILSGSCAGFVSGQNVWIYPNRLMAPWLAITAPDASATDGYCTAYVRSRMDSTPCFGTDGVCDVNYSNPE